MLRDGEKYACKACIRGHRVSSCQHADRELFHINKKGRPVSQCHHCRGLRKSRAAHVKCDCAEHHHDGEGSLGKDDCPCVTGAKCTCAFKKELPDIDEDSKPFKPAHHKPAFQARRSESAIPKARPDGTHHPQHHRTNNAAHQFGIPYTIKRLHSDGSHSHADTLFSPASAIDFTGFDFGSSSSGPSGTATAQVYPSYIPSSPHDTRLTRSAHASPILGPVAGTNLDENISARGVLDMQPSIATSAYWNSQLAAAQRHSINDFSNFSLDALDPYAADYEEPGNAAALLGTDWSQIGLDSSLDPANAQDYYPPPQSNASIDFSLSGRPGLSHSSSGTASDVGEPVPADFGQLSNSVQTVTLGTSYGLLGTSQPPNYDLNSATANNFNLNLISSLDLGSYNNSMGLMSNGDMSTAGNNNSPSLGNIGDASLQQPFLKTENFGMGMPFTPPFNNATNTPPLQQQQQQGRSVSHTPPSSLPGLAMPNLPEDDENDDGSGSNGNNNNATNLWGDFNVYNNSTMGSLSDGLEPSPGTTASSGQPHWI